MVVFIPATRNDVNTGVQDANGNTVSTLHDMFVDDNIYADVFDVTNHCMKQVAAASIEAIVITLGSYVV